MIRLFANRPAAYDRARIDAFIEATPDRHALQAFADTFGQCHADDRRGLRRLRCVASYMTSVTRPRFICFTMALAAEPDHYSICVDDDDEWLTQSVGFRFEGGPVR